MREQDELITIIVPFFNMEGFIAESIQSVLSQTYENWELILADDGSTDSSPDLARGMRDEDPDRIRYVQHPGGVNKGLTATRNLGLRASSGSLVALLDADDVWLPRKLEIQAEIMRRYRDLAMVCNASLYWSSWQDDDSEDHVVPVGGPQDQIIEPPELVLSLYPLGDQASPCPCSIMMRREAIIRHGGFEEEFTGHYQMYEDQAFLSKLYLHERTYVSSLCLDRYRLRPNSLVSSATEQGKYREVRQFYLDWFSRYLERNGVAEESIREKLKKARSPHSTAR